MKRSAKQHTNSVLGQNDSGPRPTYLLPILVPGTAKDPCLGKGATLRKNKDDGYKFDFSSKSHRNGLLNELTFEYDYNAPDITGLIDFIKERLY